MGKIASLAVEEVVNIDLHRVEQIGTELGETDYDVVFDGDFRLPGRLIVAMQDDALAVLIDEQAEPQWSPATVSEVDVEAIRRVLDQPGQLRTRP